MIDGPTCKQCRQCRHWKANRLRGYLRGSEFEWQARCLVDHPKRAAPDLKRHWDSCERFALELREHEKEAA